MPRNNREKEKQIKVYKGYPINASAKKKKEINPTSEKAEIVINFNIHS